MQSLTNSYFPGPQTAKSKWTRKLGVTWTFNHTDSNFNFIIIINKKWPKRSAKEYLNTQIKNIFLIMSNSNNTTKITDVWSGDFSNNF